MKYTIEVIDDVCVETLEFPNGDQFTKKSERTDYGCHSLDDYFSEQMERAGYADEIIDAVYDLFDGFGSLEFLELDDLANGKF